MWNGDGEDWFEGRDERILEEVAEERVRAGQIEDAMQACGEARTFFRHAANVLLLRRHLRRAVLAAVVGILALLC
jgi:hypothetical protein